MIAIAISLLMTGIAFASHTSGSVGFLSTDAYLNILPSAGSAETIASSVPYSLSASFVAYNSSGGYAGAASTSHVNYDSNGHKIGSFTHADAYGSCANAVSGSSSHSVTAIDFDENLGHICAGPTWSASLTD